MSLFSGLFNKIGSSLGNVGQKAGDLSSKLNLKVPESLDLGKIYNSNVLNTGNYSLPTANNIGGGAKVPQLGDYSFLKSSKAYIPNTEFANKIANYKSKLGDKLQDATQEALQNYADNGNGGGSQIAYDTFSFNPYMAEISPAQMVEAPQMQNSKLFDYLYM